MSVVEVIGGVIGGSESRERICEHTATKVQSHVRAFMQAHSDLSVYAVIPYGFREA